MTEPRLSVKDVVIIAGLVLVLAGSLTIVLTMASDLRTATPANDGAPTVPPSMPPPTPYDPSAFLNAAVQLAGQNAEDHVDMAMATYRAEDVLAAPTREARLVDRAVGAIQLTMVPVASPPTQAPAIPWCGVAAAGEVCAVKPEPTATMGLCSSGEVYRNGQYLCRKDEETPMPTMPTRGIR